MSKKNLSFLQLYDYADLMFHAGEGANPMDWMLHEDVAQYSVRITGQGRMSLILKRDGISLVNLRTDEKWAFTEEDMKQAWKNIGVWEPDAMEKFFPDEPEEPEETPKPKPVDLSKINNVEELRNAGFFHIACCRFRLFLRVIFVLRVYFSYFRTAALINVIGGPDMTMFEAEGPKSVISTVMPLSFTRVKRVAVSPLEMVPQGRE